MSIGCPIWQTNKKGTRPGPVLILNFNPNILAQNILDSDQDGEPQDQSLSGKLPFRLQVGVASSDHFSLLLQSDSDILRRGLDTTIESALRLTAMHTPKSRVQGLSSQARSQWSPKCKLERRPPPAVTPRQPRSSGLQSGPQILATDLRM